MCCWGRMKGKKWSEKVINDEYLERIGEKRALLNNLLRSKVNCLDHILWRICLLQDSTEGELNEVKDE